MADPDAMHNYFDDIGRTPAIKHSATLAPTRN